jgi:antitoxin component of RelBE/YafQ-DinJ toxin-antitoxin module
MEKQINDSWIQFRVPKKLREEFNAECESMGIKPSKWLREQVEKLVEGDKDDNN